MPNPPRRSGKFGTRAIGCFEAKANRHTRRQRQRRAVPSKPPPPPPGPRPLAVPSHAFTTRL
uniref:Uncharacterized protein n=1 Tax=Arundo donax TaxID=35708 RepID=A0A0A9BNM9_ARUDO